MKAWVLLPLLLTACVSPMHRMQAPLHSALQSIDDPQLLADGLPSFLILLEGLAREQPDDASLQQGLAELRRAYAMTLAPREPGRAALHASKALDAAWRALDAEVPGFRAYRSAPLDEAKVLLQRLKVAQTDRAYLLASTWALWIQLHAAGSVTALSEVDLVERLLLRILALDPLARQGEPHLLLGMLAASLPEQAGRDTAKVRHHLEEAVRLSHGENGMARFLLLDLTRREEPGYAEELLELYDALDAPGLQNRIARQHIEARLNQLGLLEDAP